MNINVVLNLAIVCVRIRFFQDPKSHSVVIVLFFVFLWFAFLCFNHSTILCGDGI